MVKLEKIEALHKTIGELKKDLKKYQKLREKSSNMNFENSTQKAMEGVDSNMNWLAMGIKKDECEIHALCVEAGLADLRSDEYYNSQIHNPSGWHEQTYTPRKPKI